MNFPRIAIKLTLIACPLLAVNAWGATLCVTAGGVFGCYAHISSAVAAAAPGDTILVGPGTYTESVTITKPLSLDSFGAIIDATGLTEGIFVDGLHTPELASVHISGFTVENANNEGILIANASSVTIAGNTVQNNDKALVAGSCTDLPSFETAEITDCGEGIHLLGVDHSIVTNNTVHGNSGGILLADDTGATHDNLVSFNTTTDNAYACGIVLASHQPAAISGSAVPLGVFHNTIYKNQSMRNGLSNGGGAGIGIYASIPGAKSYGNVVVENLVSGNGLPGIDMHAHTPGQVLNDNMVVGNTSSNNGADTEDAATPGPTGINIYSKGAVTGNIFAANTIENESYGVGVKAPALVQVEFNSFLGLKVGVDNLGTYAVDATDNWWGCWLGPYYGGGACSVIAGPNVQAEPWLLLPY
jgi:parallel beta-helix repeat protein